MGIFVMISKRWKGMPAVSALVYLLSATVVSFAAESRPALELNHPSVPYFNANSLDQPRLEAVLTRNGVVVEDLRYDPFTGNMEMAPAVFKAFIDTGASGFTISHLHAEPNEYTEAVFLDFKPEDVLGQYTNLGLGGEEVGDVIGQFGLRIRNGPVDPFGMAGDFLEEFLPYESGFDLWLRQAPGVGEVNEVDLGGGMVYQLVSPVNIIGMPVIEQRVMVMRWERNEFLEALFPEIREMHTFLLGHEDPAIPETNVTLDLEMRDFVGEPDPGEVNPTTSRNPLLRDVTISHDPERDSVTGNWLFDTGAGASFISFDWARTIGLIPEEFENLEAFVVEHTANEGIISQVGGIGPNTVTVPVLELNEIRIPAREGFDLVWRNVKILVFEHPELAALELEGIFGMNLVGPAVTIDANVLEGVNVSDPTLLLTFFDDITPSPFSSMVFEVTGEETAELRLFADRELPAAHTSISFAAWRESQFGADASDDAVSGPLADPGNFGLPNLLRYGFAMDGLQPQRDHLPALTWAAAPADDTSGDGPVLVFQRFRNTTGVDYRVEFSPDLEGWQPVEDVTWEVSPLDAERETVTARVMDPVPPNGGFFRVVVEKVD